MRRLEDCVVHMAGVNKGAVELTFNLIFGVIIAAVIGLVIFAKLVPLLVDSFRLDVSPVTYTYASLRGALFDNKLVMKFALGGYEILTVNIPRIKIDEIMKPPTPDVKVIYVDNETAKKKGYILQDGTVDTMRYLADVVADEMIRCKNMYKGNPMFLVDKDKYDELGYQNPIPCAVIHYNLSDYDSISIKQLFYNSTCDRPKEVCELSKYCKLDGDKCVRQDSHPVLFIVASNGKLYTPYLPFSVFGENSVGPLSDPHAEACNDAKLPAAGEIVISYADFWNFHEGDDFVLAQYLSGGTIGSGYVINKHAFGYYDEADLGSCGAPSGSYMYDLDPKDIIILSSDSVDASCAPQNLFTSYYVCHYARNLFTTLYVCRYTHGPDLSTSCECIHKLGKEFVAECINMEVGVG